VNIEEIFRLGGPSMWPLLGLSILSLTVILERLWFWARILSKEKEIVNRILDAAVQDWDAATEIARRASNKPIGRFLYSPLRLNQPDPEVFKLALESSANEELSDMRGGDKILEAIIGLAPLLGLFGTVWGLIVSLRSIRISDLGTASTNGVTLGIGEALISTASGLVVAIVTMAFYRLFQVLLFNQIKIFNKSGSELELIYRQFWAQSDSSRSKPKKRGSPSQKRETQPEEERISPSKKRGFSSEPEIPPSSKKRDFSVSEPETQPESNPTPSINNSEPETQSESNPTPSINNSEPETQLEENLTPEPKKMGLFQRWRNRGQQDNNATTKDSSLTEPEETQLATDNHVATTNNSFSQPQDSTVEDIKSDR